VAAAVGYSGDNHSMSPVKRLRRLRRLAGLVGLGLTVAAISQEMAKPEPERTWHGKVLGIVPYDFRPPTWERIRRAYWNTDDDRLFTDRVFGVGWAINLHRASILMERGFEALMGTRAISAPSRRRSA
jgi:hypothetical protein